MANRSFAVETPEQLKELNQFAVKGGTLNAATVWNTTKRKNGGKTRWDGHIFVDFEASNGKDGLGWRRAAYVSRRTSRETAVDAELRYNAALNWCKANLQLVSGKI